MLTSEERLSMGRSCIVPMHIRESRTLKNCNDPRSQLSENHTAASLTDIHAAAIHLSPPCILFYLPFFFL